MKKAFDRLSRKAKRKRLLKIDQSTLELLGNYKIYTPCVMRQAEREIEKKEQKNI
jgi:hypothetical protein